MNERTNQTAKKVLLIDDHPLFREGIKNILTQSGEYEIVFEASTLQDAKNFIGKNGSALKQAFFIIDLSLPDGSGFELLPTIFSSVGKQARCVMLSMHSDKEYAAHAMENGALGYVVKSDDPSCLIECLATLVAGKQYMSEGAGRATSKPKIDTATSPASEPKKGAIGDTKEKLAFDKLSKREIAILRLVAQEKTSREISEQLFLSQRTVENHRANICGKLAISGAHGLLTFAVKHRHAIETLADH